MSEEQKQPDIGRILFHCGAEYPVSKILDLSDFQKDKWGHRLIVAMTEFSVKPPHKDGKPMMCMFGCPCKRAAHRKQIRCYGKDNKPNQWMVTCHIKSIDYFTPEAKK